ncbi:MAG: hypothetical protein CME61_08330 [Halobacteriovoraceae bacterium]|nr:hypothetical protein [Halobacteriovoraceae bacterium]
MGTKVTALTVAATIVCALGIGLFMQKRTEQHSAAAPIGSSLPSEPTTVQLSDMVFTSVAPEGEDLGPDAGSASAPVLAEPTVPETCDQSIIATAQPGALMEVAISAPCHAGERFTLHHGGMFITETLDPTGAFTTLLPALTERAIVIADFATGADLDAFALVSDVDDYDRVLLQWQGDLGLELHALEFGATYGQLGHVWSEAAPGQGSGRVMYLGDPDQVSPSLVQVYSIRREVVAASQAAVEISVEAEITASNCNRGIAAQLIERRNAHLRTHELTMDMPDCAAVGDFLVLNNLIESLKIVSN